MEGCRELIVVVAMQIIAIDGLVSDESAKLDTVDQWRDTDVVKVDAGDETESDKIAKQSISAKILTANGLTLCPAFCAVTLAIHLHHRGVDLGVFYLGLPTKRQNPLENIEFNPFQKRRNAVL